MAVRSESPEHRFFRSVAALRFPLLRDRRFSLSLMSNEIMRFQLRLFMRLRPRVTRQRRAQP